jgi:hypothetical protein
MKVSVRMDSLLALCHSLPEPHFNIRNPGGCPPRKPGYARHALTAATGQHAAKEAARGTGMRHLQAISGSATVAHRAAKREFGIS